MEFRRIRTLRGPNIWSRKVALEAWVDLGALKDTPSDAVPGFVDNLMALLPGLIEHRCSIGERGGFLQRLRTGTYPAHILEHTCLELQTMAGTPVGFGKARETSEEGVYRVVVRYKEEPLARAALHVARDLLLALYAGRPFDLEPELRRLKEIAEDVRLGPSTAAIVGAAEARGIPTRRLSSGSLFALGHGARQHRIWTAETDATSAVAESIAQDKDLTKQLLRGAGVPVPDGRIVVDPADAWAAAEEIGVPVVVKPRDANHGRGVCVNLTTAEQVSAAFLSAVREGSGVMVERYAPGNEHRLLVVGDRLIAAARGDEARVIGDGLKSIRVLVEEQLNSDPRRGDSHNSPLAPIEFDDPTLLMLQSQQVGPDDVPPAAASILIQRNGNLRIDCTDEVHPSVAAHVVMAARIVGLDIAGVDVVAQDIGAPLEEQGGVVVEVNASPGLHAHLMPGVGTPRPVGEAIIDSLFPAGETGRIPIVCVTGTNGKSVVTRLTTHLLGAKLQAIGTAWSDGVTIGERSIERGDCAGPRSARRVLLHPDTELAVFEAGRGGILREGLGFDKCDVAVVTNIGSGDHLGLSSVENVEQMFTVKRCPVDVVMPHGASVLNAEDPLVADMARLSDGAVVFFARDPGNAVLRAHLAEGKRAIYVREGMIVSAQGASETPVASLQEVPLTIGGRVPFQTLNVLAAVAAAESLGVGVGEIRERLKSFHPASVPGRFEPIEGWPGVVILDDAHNLSAIEGLVEGCSAFESRHRSIVFSGGTDRRDEDLLAQARLVGASFDRVYLYEDSSVDGRPEGELTALLRRGIAESARSPEVVEIAHQDVAVSTALERIRPGDLLVIQTEDGRIDATRQHVRELTDARREARRAASVASSPA